MKKLLAISASIAIQSLFPILSWYVLAFCFGNDQWTLVFTLGYNQQFVWNALYGLIVTGCIKWSYKHGKENEGYIESSILICFMFMLLESTLIILSIDKYLCFFHMDTSKINKLGMFVYVSYLSLDTVSVGLSYYLDYKGLNGRALKTVLIINTLRVSSILVISRFINDEFYVLAAAAALSYAYVFYLFFKITGFKFKNFKLNVYKGIKYQWYSRIADLAMFIIFIYGIKSLSYMSGAALVAYNMMSLCTDTQWDAVEAVDTYASMKILKNENKRVSKLVIRNSFMHGVLLFMSGLIMILVSNHFMDFDLKLCLEFFILECITLPIYSLTQPFYSWLILYYHGVLMAVIPVIGYSIRIYISLCFNSVYALSFAVLVVGSFECSCYTLLYFVKRKSAIIRNIGNFSE